MCAKKPIEDINSEKMLGINVTRKMRWPKPFKKFYWEKTANLDITKEMSIKECLLNIHMGRRRNVPRKQLVEDTERISAKGVAVYYKLSPANGKISFPVNIEGIQDKILELGLYYLSSTIIWFFYCPKCQKHFWDLYIKDGVLACRVCHNLTYRSRQEHGTLNEAWRRLIEGYEHPIDRRIMKAAKRLSRSRSKSRP